MMENFGADAVRLFILSDSPPEKDVQWSEQGMVAAYKFIQKFWLLNLKIIEKLKKSSNEKKQSGDLDLTKYTNQLIDKMSNNLNKFNYNVIIANMHETYNFLNKIIEKQFKKEILSENYKKILTVMSPIVPHIIHECLENLNFDVLQKWPTINKKMLDNESVIIVIQINAKKKGTIKIKKDVEEKTIMEQIKIDDKMRKNFENKKISKIFFVKNRLFNILLK